MNFDLTQKKAWAILAFITVISQFLPYGPTLDLSFKIVNSILGMIIYAWLIFLISNIRGKNVDKKETSLLAKELSVWGYIWRTFIVQLVAVFIFMTLWLIIAGTAVPLASIPYAFISSSAGLVLAVPVTWAFFSKDRKQQLLWLLSFGRGY